MTLVAIVGAGGPPPSSLGAQVTRMALVGDHSEDAPPAGWRTRARIVHSPRTEGRKVAEAAVTPARQSTNRSVPGRRRWTSNTSPVGAGVWRPSDGDPRARRALRAADPDRHAEAPDHLGVEGAVVPIDTGARQRPDGRCLRWPDDVGDEEVEARAVLGVVHHLAEVLELHALALSHDRGHRVETVVEHRHVTRRIPRTRRRRSQQCAADEHRAGGEHPSTDRRPARPSVLCPRHLVLARHPVLLRIGNGLVKPSARTGGDLKPVAGSTERDGQTGPSTGDQAPTRKLNIIPTWLCSAMWQCAIQVPGSVASKAMSTVSPARTKRRPGRRGAG